MVWLYCIGALVVAFGISVFFGAPYVPTLRRDLRSLFDDELKLGDGDVLLDLGSGDGVVLREAAQRGARAVGYEIHPVFVLLSKVLSLREEGVTVRWANAWRAHFPPDVTIVYIFSVGRDEARLKRKLAQEAKRLGRPLLLVCYGNPLSDMPPEATHGPYRIYRFQPLHLKKA